MIEGSAAADNDRRWLAATLGVGQQCPVFDDPTLEGLRRRFFSLGVYAAGSLYEGVIASIIGQSISVSAAAIVEQRFAALFNPPIDIANRPRWPLPRADQLAIAEPAIVRQFRTRSTMCGGASLPSLRSDRGRSSRHFFGALVGRMHTVSTMSRCCERRVRHIDCRP